MGVDTVSLEDFENRNCVSGRSILSPPSRALLRAGREMARYELCRVHIIHPGELVAKVGYFGVKPRLKCAGHRWAPKLLKSVALAPGVLKCGAAPNPPGTDGRLRKKVFDPRREQSC